MTETTRRLDPDDDARMAAWETEAELEALGGARRESEPTWRGEDIALRHGHATCRIPPDHREWLFPKHAARLG